MFTFIKNLFRRESEPSALLCPHCEKPMVEGHSVDACARKGMSRRIFLGALGGAAAAIVVAPAIVTPTGGLFDPVVDVARLYRGNTFLTVEMITREALAILHNNLIAGREVSRRFERQFDPSMPKIGDTLNIRTPARFRA